MSYSKRKTQRNVGRTAERSAYRSPQSVVVPSEQKSVMCRLESMKGKRTLKLLAADIERRTGCAISIQHLSNMLKGRKKPNAAVLRYMGLTARTIYA